MDQTEKPDNVPAVDKLHGPEGWTTWSIQISVTAERLSIYEHLFYPAREYILPKGGKKAIFERELFARAFVLGTISDDITRRLVQKGMNTRTTAAEMMRMLKNEFRPLPHADVYAAVANMFRLNRHSFASFGDYLDGANRCWAVIKQKWPATPDLFLSLAVLEGIKTSDEDVYSNFKRMYGETGDIDTSRFFKALRAMDSARRRRSLQSDSYRDR
ncbi:hypothetical protein PT974_10649 [Cladobotryum mycophilum]|uniref:Uncharacterized protein n=1 Tax=Cladobotryum mycophilum TaxID=491253 RepID=A0ABR0SAZ3_9HYPO